jgi:aminopeptidase N
MRDHSMRFKYLIIPTIILSLVLGSCSQTEKTSTPAPTANTPTLPATNTSQPLPTITTAPTMANPVYTLDLLLDYAHNKASVQEIVKYQNQSGKDLTSIVLAVEPNLWADCFTLKEIKVNGQVTSSYVLDGQQLELKQNLAPMEILTLSISYDLAIPEIDVNSKAAIIRTQVFGYTSNQMNLVDWYPFVVPYDTGKGWLLNKPASYGEHLVYDSADFDVTIRFVDETAPIVAASGAETPSSSGKHFLLEKGRSFALSFSPDYLVKSQDVDGITVFSYYYSGSALGGQAALDATVRALQVFNQDFGQYPHKTLSVVEEQTAFSMEYDGLYFLEVPLYAGYSGADTDFLPSIAAHETAHQWWFGLVGTDQANEPWLDEALSTYSERLFNESYSLERGNWWYLARLSSMADVNCPVDITIYGFYNSCYYTESVYYRGGLFLQALRDRIGNQDFIAFLKDFATQFAHRRATTQDFFDVLRQHTSADLSDIIQEFFTNSH